MVIPVGKKREEKRKREKKSRCSMDNTCKCSHTKSDGEASKFLKVGCELGGGGGEKRQRATDRDGGTEMETRYRSIDRNRERDGQTYFRVERIL